MGIPCSHHWFYFPIIKQYVQSCQSNQHHLDLKTNIHRVTQGVAVEKQHARCEIEAETDQHQWQQFVGRRRIQGPEVASHAKVDNN